MNKGVILPQINQIRIKAKSKMYSSYSKSKRDKQMSNNKAKVKLSNGLNHPFNYTHSSSNNNN